MVRRLTRTLVILLMVTGLGAASRPNNPAGDKVTAKTPKQARTKAPERKPYQVGKASWYGKQFQGRSTASGEPYNMFQFTAAHRRLPLGSWIKVTNLRNGHWVIVRINDRGPVPPSRIIDLSYGAAQMIGLRPYGVAKVRLDLLPEAETLAMAKLDAAE